MTVASDPRYGKYLAATALFRGRMTLREVDDQTLNEMNRNKAYFVEWLPNNLKSSLCSIPPRGGVARSATLIAN